MKHRTHKLAAKAVAAILCTALMLTACGSKETANTETTSATATEATSVESTEVTTTEAATTEPAVEPAETPTESEAAPIETAPASTVEPTAEPVETTAAADAGYTYSEVSQTMYAKSAVNVRDLPSTDGKKIGSLKASQEIVVTGKCDQTGWYRFNWNNTTGYVSDKYIVSEKPAVNTVAANNTTAGNSNTAGNTTANAQQNTAAPAATPAPAQTTTTTVSGTEEYFDRAMAEQVFALVNNDRVANGIPALIWNEDLYNIAVQRCYENDIHAGARAGTGENYASGPTDADRFHEGWHDSTGHYNNYMNASWTDSAVAIRVVPLLGGALGYDTIAYQVFQSNGSTQSVTINTPVTENSVAAAPKTADENTSASSSNVGWSMTPPTQEDGLKKWQEQNPDVEVSFGN